MSIIYLSIKDASLISFVVKLFEQNVRRVFVDTIRNAAAAKMALLVPKGIQVTILLKAFDTSISKS